MASQINKEGKNTGIGWCDYTANLWWGCEEIHSGCDNCYARIFANRFTDNLWGAISVRKEIKSVWKDLDKYQRLAAAANEKRRVFVGSMMDIFENPKPVILDGKTTCYSTEGIRNDLFYKIQCGDYPNLLFLLLTKRPSNINKFIPEIWKLYPPENVMFGTSIVNQQTANKLVRDLSEVNGYKFLSVEPQIDYINLPQARVFDTPFNSNIDPKMQKKHIIDWVIQGGESGANRRPFNIEWAREMRNHCLYVGMPYFFKQIDKVIPIPEDLNIKQFPNI